MCTEVLDICLVVDSSRSIREKNPSDGAHDNYNLQLQFLASLINKFTIGQSETRVGVVLFSERVSLQIRLDQFDSLNDLGDAIMRLPHLGGSSNPTEALRITRTECFSEAYGDRPSVKNVALFVTYGIAQPQNRRELTIQEAANLKNSGVHLVLLGITNSVDRDLLGIISSPPNQEGVSYFTTPDFIYLNDIINAVTGAVCFSGNTGITEGKYGQINCTFSTYKISTHFMKIFNLCI